jgi:hypothetical protein
LWVPEHVHHDPRGYAARKEQGCARGPGPDPPFQVQPRDYDEQMIDGWDRDVGALLMRSA